MQFFSLPAQLNFRKCQHQRFLWNLLFYIPKLVVAVPYFSCTRKKSEKTAAQIKIDYFVQWYFSFIDSSFGDRPKLATWIITNRCFCLIFKITGCVPFSKSAVLSHSKIGGFVLHLLFWHHQYFNTTTNLSF